MGHRVSPNSCLSIAGRSGKNQTECPNGEAVASVVFDFTLQNISYPWVGLWSSIPAQCAVLATTKLTLMFTRPYRAPFCSTGEGLEMLRWLLITALFATALRAQVKVTQHPDSHLG